MKKLKLIFSGVELCSDNEIKEIKTLPGYINISSGLCEIKEAEDIGVTLRVVIEFVKSFLPEFAKWIYNKLKTAKHNPKIICYKANINAETREVITITNIDTKVEIEKKLEIMLEMSQNQ